MDLEYEVEIKRDEVTVTRRLSMHDPSELAIEQVLDRVLTASVGDVTINVAPGS